MKQRLVGHVAIWLALVAIFGGAHVARADGGIVVVGGNAVEQDRITVWGAVQDTARAAGWALAPKPLVKKDADRLLHCEDAKAPWTCVPSSLGAAGVHRVFVVTVDRKQSDAGVPIVALVGQLIVTNPQGFVVGQRFCEHCADDRLAQESANLAKEMLDSLATQTGRTIIEVATEPTGALVAIDGQRIGATNGSFNTFPGKHTVSIEKEGYAQETREVTAEEGKTASVSVQLHALDSSVPRVVTEPKVTPSRMLPGILIGSGAAVAVFGAVSIYYGQRHGADDVFRYTHATAIGVGAEVVGLGAIGVGVYMLLRGPTGTVPTASVTPGGALLGWAGSF